MPTHEGLHEAAPEVRPATMDQHRALASLGEELEAIDWYAQRIDASKDPELRAILEHNRDEEKEHAVMVLEWLRRRDPKLDGFLKQYLFTQGSITALESASASASDGAEHGPAAGDGSLGIGSLKSRTGSL